VPEIEYKTSSPYPVTTFTELIQTFIFAITNSHSSTIGYQKHAFGLAAEAVE
jgi:hypothetical protein